MWYSLSILKNVIRVENFIQPLIMVHICKSQVPPKTEGLLDMSYNDLPAQPVLPILVGFLAASLGSLKDHPFITSEDFWSFSDPLTHSVCQHKYSTFLNPPTRSFCWRNIGMVHNTPSQSNFLVLCRTYEFRV
jgi:hypothetical protein